jgi:hypothetical protein
MDKDTFDAILARVECIVRKAGTICGKYGNRKIEWLDNQDLCLMLDISPRTLHSLRENGQLPYTRIDRKMFYRPEDVEKLLKPSK